MASKHNSPLNSGTDVRGGLPGLHGEVYPGADRLPQEGMRALHVHLVPHCVQMTLLWQNSLSTFKVSS